MKKTPKTPQRPKAQPSPPRPTTKTHLAIIAVALADITRDPQNTQRHGEPDLRKTAASYVRFGEQEPVIIREATDEDRAAGVSTRYVTVAGAGRHEAVERLNAGFYDGHGFCANDPQKGRWPTIAALVTTLAEMEAMAFGITHNQTGRNAEQNWELIAKQIAALKKYDEKMRGAFHPDATGFELRDIKPLLAGDFSNVQRFGQNAGRAPADPDDNANNAAPIYTTPNMRVPLDAAIQKVRDLAGDPAMSEGRALELIAADFLSGASLDNGGNASSSQEDAPADGAGASSVATQSAGTDDDSTEVEIPEKYMVLVECESEARQAALLGQLLGEGWQCKALIS